VLALGTLDANVYLYDVVEPDLPQPAGQVSTIGFSLEFLPDEPFLVVNGGYSSFIEVWDVSSFASPQKLSVNKSHSYQVSGIAAASNGMLVSAARDSTVRIWRVENGKLVQQEMAIDSGDVNKVAVSRGGTRLATLGRDRTLRVYTVDDDVPTLELSIVVGDAAKGFVGFIGQDTLAVRTSWDTVDLWDLDVASAFERLCSGHGEPITTQQWDRVLPDVPYQRPC
jgi:WD40 repeat protein